MENDSELYDFSDDENIKLTDEPNIAPENNNNLDKSLDLSNLSRTEIIEDLKKANCKVNLKKSERKT